MCLSNLDTAYMNIYMLSFLACKEAFNPRTPTWIGELQTLMSEIISCVQSTYEHLQMLLQKVGLLLNFSEGLFGFTCNH